MSSISFHDKQHILRLFNQQGQIKNIFDDFARKAGIILSSYTDNGESNVWIRNKVLENRIDDLLNNLHEDLISNIDSNTQAAWSDSDAKNDDIVKLFIQDLSIADIVGKSAAESIEKGMFTRNMEAMKAFQQRRIDGLSVSDRIWKVTESAKENLEYMLESGISTGRPAASISQDIRQLLQDPDKRFRRIRDEKGNLVMSKPMKDYNPGPGKYRSSYKNALRIAATETNMAYRLADYERWQKMAFVVGIDVSRSKSNKGPCPVCDAMVGRYPKDYMFLGNHPWCICVAVPVMLEGDEFIDYLIDKKVPEGKMITEIPKDALSYVQESKSFMKSYVVQQNKAYYNLKK